MPAFPLAVLPEISPEGNILQPLRLANHGDPGRDHLAPTRLHDSSKEGAAAQPSSDVPTVVAAPRGISIRHTADPDVASTSNLVDQFIDRDCTLESKSIVFHSA